MREYLRACIGESRLKHCDVSPEKKKKRNLWIVATATDGAEGWPRLQLTDSINCMRERVSCFRIPLPSLHVEICGRLWSSAEEQHELIRTAWTRKGRSLRVHGKEACCLHFGAERREAREWALRDRTSWRSKRGSRRSPGDSALHLR